jgi:uncharacterized protein involved in tolerance to divalent cations
MSNGKMSGVMLLMIFLFLVVNLFSLLASANDIQPPVKEKEIVIPTKTLEAAAPETCNSMKEVHPYYYKNIREIVLKSDCFKNFMSVFPNDDETTKVREIVLDEACDYRFKGRIKGKVVIFDRIRNEKHYFVQPIIINSSGVSCMEKMFEDKDVICFDSECTN